jgi:hypothetical protein
MTKPVEVLAGQVKIHTEPTHVFVWHGRAAKDLDELRLVLDAIDRALAESGRRRLLFDSRDSDYTPPDVQKALWAWLDEAPLDRIATLVRSENLAVSVRMTGISMGIRIRAFHDATEAVRWLGGA